MDGSKNVDGAMGTSHEQVMQSLEDLDATLQQLSYGQPPTDASPATHPEREMDGTRTEHRFEAELPVPSSTARLVGDEVATILDAAEVAAERIRARAWEVAAEVQRQIRDMQGTLARLALEMSDLMKTGDRTAPDRVEPRPEEEPQVDLAVVLDDRGEEPTSGVGRVRPAGSG